MNIKEKLLDLFKQCIDRDYRDYRRLQKFGVFHESYYLSCKGLMIEDDPDPLWTYVKTWKKSLAEVVDGSSGWVQTADPHPLFDTSYYLLKYFPAGLSQNPFLHYLTHGWKKGYRPGPFFDPAIYEKKYGWDSNEGDPLEHYNNLVRKRGFSPALTFDADFYYDKNPVLAGVYHEIIKHYRLYGAAIGKSPLPVFDPLFYLTQVGEDIKTVRDPLSHYLTCGAEMGKHPARLFDPTHYSYESGGAVSLEDAFIHYLTVGVFQKKYPHKRVAALSNHPVISVLVPVYNPSLGVLRNCIRSVLYQAYPHWELCLMDDCSSDPAVKPLLTEWAAKDSRIKIGFHTENGGIARATNSAAALATGSYVAFLDNDDELTVDCLFHVAEAIEQEKADLVYSDEDLIGDDGTTLSVFRKPAFNKSLLWSHNYITHFVAVKRSLFEAVGGVNPKYDGAQDFDLMLKLEEVCGTVLHIPKVLYHWRALESSTSINHDQKSYAHVAGRAALQAALVRRGMAHSASDTDLNFFYRLRSHRFEGSCTVAIWAVEVEALSSGLIAAVISETRSIDAHVIVIGAKEQGQNYQDFLEAQETKNWSLLIAENESKADMLQQLFSNAGSDFVCLLDGEIQELSENWLVELGCIAEISDVAVVCGRTCYGGDDGTSYLFPDLENKSAQYLQDFLCNSSRHMAGLHCMQDMSFACSDITLFKREVFENAGGYLSKEFPHIFALADYSLRLQDMEQRIVYTPFAIADKASESIRISCNEPDVMQQERYRFQELLKSWKKEVLPYYNEELLSDKGGSTSSFYDWLFGKR